jgi:iron complex outermembrane recepter protein
MSKTMQRKKPITLLCGRAPSHSLILGLMLAAGLPAHYAFAQTPAEPAKPAADQPAAKPEAGKLETITVTAERRSENIKDVPNSVSAIRGENLDIINSGGQDVRMLAGRVPSLNIESSFGRAFPRFYIRGLGNTDFDLNASQPVSLVYDDVVQENPILKGFPIFDIDQIEVLRGPQGTLFGRNSPAGVVKFDSAKPRKTFESYANISYGRDKASSLEGAINAPLNATTSARFSVQLQNRDDWVTNTVKGPTSDLEGYRDSAARFQLMFQPNAGFSALFNVHHRDLDGSARLFRANIIKPGTNDLVDGFDPRKISIDGVNDQKVRSTGGSVRLRWDFSDVALNSITGYETVNSFSRGDIDGGFGAVFLPAGLSGPGVIPFAAESADGMRGHRQLTQEFRLESKGGPLKWLGGLYFFDEKFDIDSFNYDSLAPGNPVNGIARQNQKNKAVAVFGSVNFAATDAFNLRAGLRYTKDKKDFIADREKAPPFSPTFIGRLTTSTNASDVSWDLSGTYALNKDANLYARAAKGFRAPSIQGRLLFGDSLSVANSEKVTSVEAGIKTDLFDKRARLSANVFQYQVRDQQLTAVGGAANFNRLINAKKTEAYGAEIDLQAFITDSLLFSLGGSINDTKIKDPNLRVDACGSGCMVTDPIITPVNPAQGRFAPNVSINGNPLPQAPKYVLNTTLRYAIPVGDGEIFIFTDWAYRSKINFFLYESKEYTGKPLLEGGLRVGYKFADKYEFAVFGRNITNQIRVVGGIDFNNLTGFINEPRFYGAQFKANF